MALTSFVKKLKEWHILQASLYLFSHFIINIIFGVYMKVVAMLDVLLRF